MVRHVRFSDRRRDTHAVCPVSCSVSIDPFARPFRWLCSECHRTPIQRSHGRTSGTASSIAGIRFQSAKPAWGISSKSVCEALYVTMIVVDQTATVFLGLRAGIIADASAGTWVGSRRSVLPHVAASAYVPGNSVDLSQRVTRLQPDCPGRSPWNDPNELERVGTRVTVFEFS